eukprot:1156659-Pelagomonas_calceolata.AAC.4
MKTSWKKAPPEEPKQLADYLEGHPQSSFRICAHTSHGSAITRAWWLHPGSLNARPWRPCSAAFASRLKNAAQSLRALNTVSIRACLPHRREWKGAVKEQLVPLKAEATYLSALPICPTGASQAQSCGSPGFWSPAPPSPLLQWRWRRHSCAAAGQKRSNASVNLSNILSKRESWESNEKRRKYWAGMFFQVNFTPPSADHAACTERSDTQKRRAAVRGHTQRNDSADNFAPCSGGWDVEEKCARCRRHQKCQMLTHTQETFVSTPA